MAQHVTRPKLVRAAQRRALVLALRCGGKKYAVIAQEVIAEIGIDALPKGYNERQACQDVLRELKRLAKIRTEQTELLRQHQLERLDTFLESVYDNAITGDVFALDRALRIEQERAKLLGLYPPVKVAPTNPEGTDEYSFGASLEERAKRLWELAQEIGPAGGGSEESLDPAEGAADTGVH